MRRRRHSRSTWLSAARAWCAAGRVDGRQLQLGARGWPLDGLRLVRLAPDAVPGSDGRMHP